MSETRTRHISRRTFLLAAAAGAVGGAVYLGGCTDAPDATAAKSSWSEWLLDSRNRAALQRLGNAYRMAHPEERDGDTLNAYINEAVNAAAPVGGADDMAAQVVALRQRVRTEYRQAEVVRLEGWVLSVTEARLYALAALESA